MGDRVKLVDDRSVSSRVGDRIRAAWRGPVESERSTSGTPKASVLPDPVGDWTTPFRSARRKRNLSGTRLVDPT
jgi:hypothetical protein